MEAREEERQKGLLFKKNIDDKDFKCSLSNFMQPEMEKV
jgi:hypothetical protein